MDCVVCASLRTVSFDFLSADETQGIPFKCQIPLLLHDSVHLKLICKY